MRWASRAEADEPVATIFGRTEHCGDAAESMESDRYVLSRGVRDVTANDGGVSPNRRKNFVTDLDHADQAVVIIVVALFSRAKRP